MSTTTSALDVEADTDALIKHLAEGTPIDPDLEARIRERGKRATEETLRIHGIQSIGAQIIREIRDETET